MGEGEEAKKMRDKRKGGKRGVGGREGQKKNR